MRISDWSSDVCSSDLSGRLARAPCRWTVLPAGVPLFTCMPLSGAGKGIQMDLNRYTERSRGFLQAAQTLASRKHHQRLTPEHLLKVLLDDEEGLARNLIRSESTRLNSSHYCASRMPSSA